MPCPDRRSIGNRCAATTLSASLQTFFVPQKTLGNLLGYVLKGDDSSEPVCDFVVNKAICASRCWRCAANNHVKGSDSSEGNLVKQQRSLSCSCAFV